MSTRPVSRPLTVLRSVLTLCLLVGFLSCEFHSEYQYEGADYLQGVWVQEQVLYEDELIQYTLHELKFTCDSVYALLHTRSKALNTIDSCFNGGKWTEYAKGIYVVRGDSLLVDGLYTRADGKQKISGCYRSGQYIPRFKIVRYSADSLELHNRYDSRPILLRKTQEISCVPRKRWE